jgi:cyclic pyranopterin phosphate synthase
MSAEPLRDGHGRLIGDLRVSVTDRCNFRCQYCMPAEGLPWLERAEILTFEEIARLVRMFVSLGVHDVRLTGGEPLVRREFPKLARMLSEIEDLADLPSAWWPPGSSASTCRWTHCSATASTS